jgi:hypothetical protein
VEFWRDLLGSWARVETLSSGRFGVGRNGVWSFGEQ